MFRDLHKGFVKHVTKERLYCRHVSGVRCLLRQQSRHVHDADSLRLRVGGRANCRPDRPQFCEGASPSNPICPRISFPARIRAKVVHSA